MKIKTYKATEEENIYLKLNETPTGVDVVVVNDCEVPVTAGIILTIEPKGIRLQPRVSKNIGLPRDTKGAVIVI